MLLTDVHTEARRVTFDRADLHPQKTGLPFVVFISRKGGSWHDIRVTVSPSPRVQLDAMSTYTLCPFRHRVGPALSAGEAGLLRAWAEKNLQVLLDHWTGVIPFTEDVLDQLVPV